MIADAFTALGFSEFDANSGKICIVNTLPWSRPQHLSIPASSTSSTCAETTAWTAGTYGVSEITTPNKPSTPSVTVKETHSDVFLLENSQFSITITSGVITSLYDKSADREIIPSGAAANQLVIFDDKPLNWQAWDVEIYHLSSRQVLKPGKTTITVETDTLCSVTTETKISEKSSILTTVSLRAPSSNSTTKSQPILPIEITADVTWHEDKKFLKVEFPVDIRNTSASYETQYGIIQRPTHYNTTWDHAKFEVVCHKWADLSEAGYGVSILNDCKYGFATQGNVMRLSLLRSPKAPDEFADMGRHVFRYAILPHQGSLDARTVRAARELNNPLSMAGSSSSDNNGLETEKVKGEADRALFPYTKLTSYLCLHPDISRIAPLMASIRMSEDSNPAIILDTVKRGEDDEDVSRGELPVRKGKSVIVRLYDSLGGRCRGKVELGELANSVMGKGSKGIRKVEKCNILEDDGEEVEVKDGGFEVELGPFEVGTWRIVLA